METKIEQGARCEINQNKVLKRGEQTHPEDIEFTNLRFCFPDNKERRYQESQA